MRLHELYEPVDALCPRILSHLDPNVVESSRHMRRHLFEDLRRATQIYSDSSFLVEHLIALEDHLACVSI